MTHEEAYHQIAAALPYLDSKLSNQDGVLYVNGEVHFVLQNGLPTNCCHAQRLLVTDKPHEQMEWRKTRQTPSLFSARKFDPAMWEGLNARAYSAVLRLRPERYEDLTSLQIIQLKNVGRVTLGQIKEFLKQKGHTLL